MTSPSTAYACPPWNYFLSQNEDWLTAVIGKADPTFLDSKYHSDSGRPSSCNDMHGSKSDDEDTDFYNANQNLEDLL
jgi:hypothetical protein